MEGHCNKEIKPWYRGFKGRIVKVNSNEYMSIGVYKIVGTNKIQVTELPIKKWTTDYKEFLEKMMPGVADKPAE